MDDRIEQGLALYHAGRYFEAHEVLEEAWTSLPQGAERRFLQGLIHVAVAYHHLEHGNRIGAERQLRKALAKLGAGAPAGHDIDVSALASEVAASLRSLEQGDEPAAAPGIRRTGKRKPANPTPRDPETPRTS